MTDRIDWIPTEHDLARIAVMRSRLAAINRVDPDDVETGIVLSFALAIAAGAVQAAEEYLRTEQ